MYALIFQVVSFPQVFPPLPCTHLSSPPYLLLAPPILLFVILSPDNYSAGSTGRKTPHCSVTSSLLGPYIFLSTLFSDIFSPCWSLNVRNQVSHPYKSIGTIRVLYIWIFAFCKSSGELQYAGPNGSRPPWFQPVLQFFVNAIFIC
jgi:hypothetical protein